MRYGLSFLVFALALAAGQATAGVVVTSTQTKRDSKETSQTTIYAETDRLKFVMPEITMIFRGDQNRIWTIIASRKTYTEMTPETLQQMAGLTAGAAAAGQARMKAQLEQL